MVFSLILLILEFDRFSNLETYAELKTRAMNFILREVCKKYREQRDPNFTSEEVKHRLQELGPKYIDLNIADLFRGSGLIDIDKRNSLTLIDKGIRSCESGELLD
jgi:hypothetical protein